MRFAYLAKAPCEELVGVGNWLGDEGDPSDYDVARGGCTSAPAHTHSQRMIYVAVDTALVGGFAIR